MRVILEKGESSNNNHREKIPFVRNVRGKKSENANENVARSYVRSKKPRLRWTDDLHRCFLRAVAKLGGEDRATPKMILHAMGVEGVTVSHVKSHLQMHRSMRQTTLIQEAIDAAKKSGKDTELIAKLPVILKTVSRPVSRRQTRLQTIKALLVKNALVRHFSDDHAPPLQPQPMNDDTSFTIVHMPCENGKRSHDYMVFNDLVQGNPSLTPSTIEGNKKRKEKIIYGEACSGDCQQMNDSRNLEELYREVMNKCKSTVFDPKLRLQRVCSAFILHPNHNNISLNLTL